MSKDSPVDNQEYVRITEEEEEEEELVQLTSQAININKTGLGRQTKNVFIENILVLP